MKHSLKVLALGFILAVAGPAFAQQTATEQLSITVAAPPISITTTQAQVPNGIVGTVYTASFSATGGVGPYIFSISSGSVPAGTSLVSGTLSGTPTTAGTSSFTVKVADSESTPLTATANFSIIIYTQLKITTTTLPAATIGTAYSQTIAVTGGTAPYTFAVSGSLPAGLSLNTSTGVISGTPTTAGSSTFTITVTDSSLVALSEANSTLTAGGKNENAPPSIPINLRVVAAN
jgi:hypothetical protein